MAEQTETPDLRRARRERGRTAVLDTAFEIFLSGNERPTASEIARRAGVSTSSLFRYFESIDDLRMQVAARFLDDHRDVLQPEPPAGAGYDQRRQLFVDLRIRLATTIGPMSRRLQGRVVDEPGLLPIQTTFRSLLAEQVTTHFDPELSAMTQAGRHDLAGLIDAMTSIEAYRTLHEVHERSETQIRRSWRSAIDTLVRVPWTAIAPAPVAPGGTPAPQRRRRRGPHAERPGE